jgi:hypothetical protein
MTGLRLTAVGLLALAMGCASAPDTPDAPVPATKARPDAAKATQSAKAAPPAKAAPKAVPTLDIAALTARLRNTDAIGVFTKLALKNQMDDLLQQARTVHEGGRKDEVGALRQPYDMLVLKVLAVVQDGDPSLARAISGSREALWAILSDPVKFNALA